MTNPKCPFCTTPAKSHEAGRCLDHWIEAAKQGYKYVIKGHPLSLSKERQGFFYGVVKSSPLHSEEREYTTKFTAPEYSKDLNLVKCLWDTEWLLCSGDEDLFEIWNRDEFIATHEMREFGSGVPKTSHAIAISESLAVAICRAHIKDNSWKLPLQ